MKMPSFDTNAFRAQFRDGMQPHVAEPIEAVGALNRANGMRNLLVGKASPLLRLALNRKAKHDAGGLPNRVAVAVTASTVHLFTYQPRVDGADFGQEITRWPRAGLQVALRPSALATQVDLTLADGSTFALEAPKGSDFNDELLASLRSPVALPVA